jgi:hypothetical protein
VRRSTTVSPLVVKVLRQDNGGALVFECSTCKRRVHFGAFAETSRAYNPGKNRKSATATIDWPHIATTFNDGPADRLLLLLTLRPALAAESDAASASNAVLR